MKITIDKEVLDQALVALLHKYSDLLYDDVGSDAAADFEDDIAEIGALAQPAAQPTEPPANPGWCQGCNPDNCQGCGPGMPAPPPAPISGWWAHIHPEDNFVELVNYRLTPGDKRSGWVEHEVYTSPQAAQPQPVQQEPVGWHTEDHLTDRSATTYDKNMMYRWQCKGWPVTPLYTSPQAAQPTYGSPELEQLILDRLAQKAQPAAQPTDQDDAEVDAFCVAMKEKLRLAKAKGRCGWRDCPKEDLSRMLREHVEKGDPRDVANFCMFLHTLGHAIEPAAQPTEPAKDIGVEPAGEPVGQVGKDATGMVGHIYDDRNVKIGDKLYTRPAVPLTDEQIEALRLATGYAAGLPRFTEIVRTIEAAHKIGGDE